MSSQVRARFVASVGSDLRGRLAGSRYAGNAPLDVGPQPSYMGEDLDVIADQLIERYAAAANVS